jgi:hypothetical protein
MAFFVARIPRQLGFPLALDILQNMVHPAIADKKWKHRQGA